MSKGITFLTDSTAPQILFLHSLILPWYAVSQWSSLEYNLWGFFLSLSLPHSSPSIPLPFSLRSVFSLTIPPLLCHKIKKKKKNQRTWKWADRDSGRKWVGRGHGRTTPWNHSHLITLMKYEARVAGAWQKLVVFLIFRSRNLKEGGLWPAWVSSDHLTTISRWAVTGKTLPLSSKPPKN